MDWEEANRLLARAAVQFQKENYNDALEIYNSFLAQDRPCDDKNIVVNAFFNRSACFLKLKQYAQVVNDCNNVLLLESNHLRAYSRKTKALTSLGQFVEALDSATKWVSLDPQSTKAKGELVRLSAIVAAMDQQSDDEMLAESTTAHARAEKSPSKEGTSSEMSESSDSSLLSNDLTASSRAVHKRPDQPMLSIALPSPSMQSNLCGLETPHGEPFAAFWEEKSYAAFDAGAVGSHPTEPLSDTVQTSPSAYSDVLKRTLKSSNVVQPRKEREPNEVAKITEPEQETKASADLFCCFCEVGFDSRLQLREHCSTESHAARITSDDGATWKYREPPRGLTAEEYLLCRKSSSCILGETCTYAHSEEELLEWRKRFEHRRERVQRAVVQGLSIFPYCDQLTERLLDVELVESMDSVNISTSDSTEAINVKKNSAKQWIFTVVSKMHIRAVALWDEAHRLNFYISSICTGPRRSQRSHKLEPHCQEWQFHGSCSDKPQSSERVMRVKVNFRTEVYGTFRQTVVFDFGLKEILTRTLSVEATPEAEAEDTIRDLLHSETTRWSSLNRKLVPFEPKFSRLEPEDDLLMQRYPLPNAATFNDVSFFELDMSKETYRARMHGLLYVEEMAQYSALSTYNIRTKLVLTDRFLLTPANVSIAKYASRGELFARMRLQADISEDSAHGRLILQNVHHVYIAMGPEDAEPHEVYEALIEEKGKNFIFLRLSAKFVAKFGLKHDTAFYAQVQFCLNRLPLCEMHEAVDTLPNLNLVFPDLELKCIPWNPARQWGEHDDKLMNAKQKECVVAVTTTRLKLLPPILLVGPYGTGKTYTLAMTALELLKQRDTRVLICTHSNSAADLYIKDYLFPKIEEIEAARPVRIYYRHRWIHTVHPHVLPFCLLENTGKESRFRLPVKDDLLKHRVCVTTLSTSRYLQRLGLQPGFFTHILIDEAAQAHECETIAPLALAGLETRVVLAGDHMQITPEVYSNFVRERRLHISLLERMFDLYPDNHCCKIMLVENYRSHRDIISLTSELFYSGRLLASGNQKSHSLYHPVSFCAARGEDEQHQNNTAFYNLAEVFEVVDRVDDLCKHWPNYWGTFDESGICVVSPYADQVVRLRAELRKRKLGQVNVERVFNVQGKQFRVVILTTVRTRRSCSILADEDVDYGFLSNAKLLNTAITRAQSLLMVVGDPVALCSLGKCRKLWERFLEICHESDSLRGITWKQLRGLLDGVERKKTFVLNPLAPEFVPNRLRHALYQERQAITNGSSNVFFDPNARLLAINKTQNKYHGSHQLAQKTDVSNHQEQDGAAGDANRYVTSAASHPSASAFRPSAPASLFNTMRVSEVPMPPYRYVGQPYFLHQKNRQFDTFGPNPLAARWMRDYLFALSTMQRSYFVQPASTNRLPLNQNWPIGMQPPVPAFLSPVIPPFMCYTKPHGGLPISQNLLPVPPPGFEPRPALEQQQLHQQQQNMETSALKSQPELSNSEEEAPETMCHSAHLQAEVFSYMLQKEGEEAAHAFLQGRQLNLQASRLPEKRATSLPPSVHASTREVYNDDPSILTAVTSVQHLNISHSPTPSLAFTPLSDHNEAETPSELDDDLMRMIKGHIVSMVTSDNSDNELDG